MDKGFVSNLHVYFSVVERGFTKNSRELEAILSEYNSAEIPQVLGCKLEACSLPLPPPELTIYIENPISKQYFHV